MGIDPWKCGRMVDPDADGVEVWKNSSGLAHYHGLLYCADPWSCAECAYRIGRMRAGELGYLLDRHHESGGKLFRMTFRFPHGAGNHLKKSRDCLMRARQMFRSGRVAALRESMGYLGDFSTVEYAYHETEGWHPYLHILALTDREPEFDTLGDLWDKCCELWAQHLRHNRFLCEDPTSSMTIEIPEDTDGISLARDMGLLVDLKAVEHRVHYEGERMMFQIRRTMNLGEEREGDSDLWQAWSLAMRGFKQVSWSGKIRSLYLEGAPVFADQDLVQNGLCTEEEEPLGHLPADVWNLLSLKPHFYSDLLLRSGSHGRDGFREFVEEVKQEYLSFLNEELPCNCGNCHNHKNLFRSPNSSLFYP